MVRVAILENLEIAAAHLDLEGVAYIKLVRTGAQRCFSMDVTSEVLKEKGFTTEELEKHFWSKPSMEKWDK
jgi:hypothetical protein